MYYRDDQDQLSLEEFFLSFGGQLCKDNRWVRMAAYHESTSKNSIPEI